MRTLFATTAALAISTAGAVAAQDLSYGGIMTSYGKYSLDGDDADIRLLAGDLGIEMQNVDIWISGVQGQLSPEGTPTNLTFDAWTIGAGVSFADTYRIDASSSDLDLNIGGLGAGIGLDEIGFAYDNGTMFGRLSYAQVDQEAAGVDALYGLMAGYAFTDSTEVALSIHSIDETTNTFEDPIYILSANHDGGRWGVELDAASAKLGTADLRIVALSGEYDFTDTWSAYGSYANADLDGNALTSMRVGGAYNMGDYRVFADYSVSDLEGTSDNVTGVSFGVSMDFGDKPTSHETTTDRLLGFADTVGGYDF